MLDARPQYLVENATVGRVGNDLSPKRRFVRGPVELFVLRKATSEFPISTLPF